MAQQNKKSTNLEDKVTINLFKDNNKYRDDVTVIVNGSVFQIKRGVPVEVPRYVASVLQDQERQMAAASLFIEQNTND